MSAARTEHAVGHPDALPDWARAVSADIDLESLGEVVVARDISAAFPDLADDAEFAGYLRASVLENLHALREFLCGRVALDEVHLERPLVFGSVQARLHIPQASLQRSYRVGFTAMWQEWSDQLRRAAATPEISRTDALEVMDQVTRMIMEYQDYVACQVAANYIRTDESLSRSRARERQVLIRRLLEPDEPSLSPLELVVLDYDLHASHLAILLPTTSEETAARLTPALRAAASVRRSLIYPINLTSTVIWLGSHDWTPTMSNQVKGILDESGFTAALSEPEPGVAGLRLALECAREVVAVRDVLGDGGGARPVQYCDVRLEVLLLRNLDLARAFAQAELGPLCAGTAEAARLRDTLAASFQHGSHVATAAQLGLHEHTVRNRLQRIEQLLGRPVAEHRVELQVALRLSRLVVAG